MKGRSRVKIGKDFKRHDAFTVAKCRGEWGVDEKIQH
jgi:hypothetical protein